MSSKLFNEQGTLKIIKFYGNIDVKGLVSGSTKTFIGKLSAIMDVDISYYTCGYTDAATFIDDKCE